MKTTGLTTVDKENTQNFSHPVTIGGIRQKYEQRVPVSQGRNSRSSNNTATRYQSTHYNSQLSQNNLLTEFQSSRKQDDHHASLGPHVERDSMNLDQIKEIHCANFHNPYKRLTQGKPHDRLTFCEQDLNKMHDQHHPGFQEPILEDDPLNQLRHNLYQEISNQVAYRDPHLQFYEQPEKITTYHHHQKRKTKGKQMSMYDRQLLWDQSRKNKIKQMKETVSLSQLEDCTFKPQLLSQSSYSRRGVDTDIATTIANSQADQNQYPLNQGQLQYDTAKTMPVHRQSTNMIPQDCEEEGMEQFSYINRKSIEKHINRMTTVKFQNEFKQQIKDALPGSGKLWQNKLTKPSVPKITGIKQKGRNCSIGDYDTLDYMSQKAGGRIRSLKRPISPSHSSYQSGKKRFQNYPHTESIDQVLSKSNKKLKHYYKQASIANTGDSIMQDLEREGLLQRSASGFSNYCSAQSLQAPQHYQQRADSNMSQNTSNPYFLMNHHNLSKCSYKQQEARDNKTIDIIRFHIQSLDI